VNKELIIDGSSSEVIIALLEDKKLVELHKEFNDNDYAVGDIYLGRVKKLITGLNAAFVDVGYEKDAFLHYLDLGPQIISCNNFVKEASSGKGKADLSRFKLENDIPKNGKINHVLHTGDKILVRIAKEPISAKGPRVTSELSFPGRFLVLVPFSNKISMSQKINDLEEKSRLKRLVQSIRPNNFGIIVRTVAENRKVAELYADLNDLMQKWNDMIAKLSILQPPIKVHGELGRSFTMLRDILNESFNNIYVNSPQMADEIRGFIRTFAPDKEEIVKLFKGKANIFENYGIDKQIKSSFGKKVMIKSGSYLVIEHTEAFHVIDVNSGYQHSDEKNQEANALEVNLEAAEEISRQLRLRDMGGIIVVDFIDMVNGLNRRKLYERLKDLMESDRAKHSILPPSKFGLVQITRQRVRPETNIDIREQCPVCEGTGKIKPHVLFIDDIKNQLQYLFREQNEKKLTLMVSPYIHAYLTKGLFSILFKWKWHYKRTIKLIPSSSYHFLEYRFFNARGEEIHL
jgi:ribonuclease G